MNLLNSKTPSTNSSKWRHPKHVKKQFKQKMFHNKQLSKPFKLWTAQPQKSLMQTNQNTSQSSIGSIAKSVSSVNKLSLIHCALPVASHSQNVSGYLSFSFQILSSLPFCETKYLPHHTLSFFACSNSCVVFPEKVAIMAYFNFYTKT
jgi:hypothetical protein